MHTLDISENSIEVVFVGNGDTFRLFTFSPDRVPVALALVNYLNGGAGGSLNWEICPEEVVVR